MGALKIYRLGLTFTALVALMGAGCGGSSTSPKSDAGDASAGGKGGSDAGTSDAKINADGAGGTGTDAGADRLGTDAAAGGTGTDAGTDTRGTGGTAGGTAGAGGIGNGGRAGGAGGTGAVAGAGVGGVGAVGGAGGTIVAPTLTRIEIAPPTPQLAIGTNVVMTITADYSDGTTADVSTAAALISSGPAVATVSGHTVTAVAVGSTTVTASYMGHTATATVTVTSAALQSITVDPAAPKLAVGASQQLTATGSFADGTKQDITGSVVWTSSDQTVSTVSAGGSVKAVKVGTSTITATMWAISGSATTTVTAATITGIDLTPSHPSFPLGTRAQFVATATYTDGTTLDVTGQSTWTVSDGTVATISTGGNLSTIKVGTVDVQAVSGGITGTTTVTVTMASLVSIAVTPAMAKVAVAATQAFTAKGTYSDMSVVDLTQTASWTSDSAVASISNAAGQQGVATGVTAGTANVRATIGTISGTASLTVSAAIVTSVTVAPKSATLPIGFTQTVTAIATYSDGTSGDVTSQAVWSSTDTTVATVTNASGGGNVAGTVTAVKVGTATVTAAFSGMSDTSAITVTAAVPTEVDVSPATATVAAGLKQAFTAVAKYSDGTSADVTTQVTWSSSATTIATVSNAAGSKGSATSVAVGTATITATLGTIKGTAVLTVSAAVVQSIQVTPFVSNLTVGASQALTVTAIFSNGTTRNVTTTTALTSSSTTIATIATTMGAGGGTRVTGVAAGSATITGTYMGFTATATVNVTVPVVVTLTGFSVSPALASVRVGLTQAFVGTAIYSDGSTANVTGTTTWSSSNIAVANISNAGGGGPGGGGGGGRGTATGIAVGTTTITGSYMGLQAVATLTVTAPMLTGIEISPLLSTVVVNHTQQFTATALFDNATTQTVTTTATWTSSATAVLAISDAGGGGGPGGGGTPRGQATGLTVGTSTVTATYMGFTASTVVTVTAPKLTSLQVTPTNPQIPKGSSLQLQLTAVYDDFSTANVTAGASWVTDAPTVATISSAGATRGRATGLTPGSTVVTATYAGMAATTTLTVTTALLASVQVTPTNPTVPVGLTQRFVATALLTDSTSVDVTATATWTSSDTTVATLSNATGSQGTATPVKAGTVTVTATYMGMSGTTTLVVSTGVLTSIQVTGISGNLAVGGHLQLAATGQYNDGSSYPLTSLATWISTTPAAATVSSAAGSQGLVTGVANGTTTIEAHFSGVVGTASLTVGP